MQIDWLAFTPGPAFLGGMLLGIAAALYVILHGRILGISAFVADMKNRGARFAVVLLELEFAGRDLVRNFFSIDRNAGFPDDWWDDRRSLLLGFGWRFSRLLRFVCSEARCVKDDE